MAQRAASIIEENRLEDGSISDLADRLGITDRHLRRIFAAEFGVSPIRYLQTCRLLLAKNLLSESSLTVTQIAVSSGFGSLRRFNDLFKAHYRLAPSELRKNGKTRGLAGEKTKHGGITLRLDYRPPYQWDALLEFLAQRAIPGIESVKDGVYRRTVVLSDAGKVVRGWIAVENLPDKNSVSASLSPSLLSVVPKTLARVRQLFDLNCDPVENDTEYFIVKNFSIAQESGTIIVYENMSVACES